MNKIRACAILALILAFHSGCNEASRQAAPAPDSVTNDATQTSGGAAEGAVDRQPGSGVVRVDTKVGAPTLSGRSLIVSMDLALSVDDVDRAKGAIAAIAARSGGYLEGANISGPNEYRSAHLVLRIPARNVADVRGELGGIGTLTSDIEKTEDVTEEHADIDARLRNARIQETRIQEIMAKKTGTIAETIQAETELARVRETVERLDAQKRALDGKIDLATIQITLSRRAAHDPPQAAWETPGTSIANAWHAGLRGAAALAIYGAMAFVASAPVLVPLAGLVLLIAFVVRRRRRRMYAALDG